MVFNTDNISATYMRYVLPTTAALIVSGLYQVVDGLFIGNYVGADGLTAINMAWPMISFIFGIGLMIGVGTGALASIEQGKNDNKKAAGYIAQYFQLIIIFAILSCIVIFSSIDVFIKFQNASPEIAKMTKSYLSVMSFGAPIVLGSISCPMLLRNLGKPSLATISVISGAISNIILDYFFIVVFGMGLFGAALATVIAETSTVAVCLFFILSKRNPIRPVREDFRFKFSKALKTMKVGFSSMITYVYIGFVVIFYNRLLMIYGDSTYVAAYSIMGYLAGLYYLLVEGMAGGMQPIASYLYGARKYDALNKLIKLTLKVCFVWSFIAFLAIQCFPHLIASIFTSDTAVLTIAERAMRIHLSVFLIDGIAVTIVLFFQAVGYASRSIFMSLFSIIIKFPFLYVLPKIFGLEGIWYVSPICVTLYFCMAVFLFTKIRKRMFTLAS